MIGWVASVSTPAVSHPRLCWLLAKPRSVSAMQGSSGAMRSPSWSSAAFASMRDRLLRAIAPHDSVSRFEVLRVQVTWGGDIVTAVIAHLAHSTPPEFLFCATDFNSYVTRSIAEGAPQRRQGRARASDQPGLGISPRFGVLGKPVLEIR